MFKALLIVLTLLTSVSVHAANLGDNVYGSFSLIPHNGNFYYQEKTTTDDSEEDDEKEKKVRVYSQSRGPASIKETPVKRSPVIFEF
jgi:hypothetical protein